MVTSYEKFNALVTIYNQQYPKLKIKYKSESLLMKIIGFIIFFNRSFMTKYITTIGSTIYFPNKQELENEKSNKYLKILTHEVQHIHDSNGFWKSLAFNLGYLFPQSLAPLMLIFCAIYWWLGLILFAIFLLPLPAPFRKYLELRGYCISLFMSNMTMAGSSPTYRKLILQQYIYDINSQFTTGAYYFMWPFGVKTDLEDAIDDIVNERYQEKNKFAAYVKECWAKLPA